MVTDKSILSIDGSTTNTGMSILRESDGCLFYTLLFTREKEETPVQYKVRLKREVKRILDRNTLINKVFYEEAFVGHITSVANLMMLRTFVEEIVVENEPNFNYLKHAEINNQKWKRLFLSPDKVPSGTENQKKAVRDKMLGYLPMLDKITQDEIDALAMGFVAVNHIKEGCEEDLESKKRVHPFQYNTRFIGANDDEGMLDVIADVYDGPTSILENGIMLTSIKGTSNFDKHVYSNMGNEDKLIIVKFNSDHHGNIILKSRIGHLASSYDYIYAVIWRKRRK